MIFKHSKQINHQIEVVADMNDLRKLVSEYGKIGSNLNQIAKHFNSGGSQSRAIENEIHQCITDLFLLRKEVLKLSGGMNGNRKSTLKAEIQITQLTLTICMNLLLHTALISKISAMMRILLSIGSRSLTNLPKKKINNIFGGYTPKPL